MAKMATNIIERYVMPRNSAIRTVEDIQKAYHHHNGAGEAFVSAT